MDSQQGVVLQLGSRSGMVRTPHYNGRYVTKCYTDLQNWSQRWDGVNMVMGLHVSWKLRDGFPSRTFFHGYVDGLCDFLSYFKIKFNIIVRFLHLVSCCLSVSSANKISPYRSCYMTASCKFLDVPSLALVGIAIINHRTLSPLWSVGRTFLTSLFSNAWSNFTCFIHLHWPVVKVILLLHLGFWCWGKTNYLHGAESFLRS